MANNRAAPLDERIKSIQAEIDAFIDAKIAAIKKDCPGLPDGTIRNTLVRGGCPCASFLEIKAQDDKAAGQKSAA